MSTLKSRLEKLEALTVGTRGKNWRQELDRLIDMMTEQEVKNFLDRGGEGPFLSKTEEAIDRLLHTIPSEELEAAIEEMTRQEEGERP